MILVHANFPSSSDAIRPYSNNLELTQTMATITTPIKLTMMKSVEGACYSSRGEESKGEYHLVVATSTPSFLCRRARISILIPLWTSAVNTKHILLYELEHITPERIQLHTRPRRSPADL